MPKTPFVWKAELGGAPDNAFSAQLGSVTYYAVTRSYGHPASVDGTDAQEVVRIRPGRTVPRGDGNQA